MKAAQTLSAQHDLFEPTANQSESGLQDAVHDGMRWVAALFDLLAGADADKLADDTTGAIAELGFNLAGVLSQKLERLNRVQIDARKRSAA